MLRTILIATLAAITLSAPAKINKTKTTKKKKVEVKAEEKVDTVSVKEFSYDLGVAQVNGLKPYLAQRMNIDTVNNMSDFVRGVKEVANKPNDKTLTAYAAGLQIGAQITQQFATQINQQITGEPNKEFIDREAYIQGLLAALTGEGMTITVDSASAVANKQMEYYRNQLMEQKYGDNRKAGEEWLAANAKKEGVVTLPSGVQYKILTQGNGPKPTATSNVKVNYEGKTIDGTVFDSSYERKKPATFRLNQVIKGWSEALEQMPTGSTWEIYIPQELGYGAREAGKIKPFSTLIFKVELLEIIADTTK